MIRLSRLDVFRKPRELAAGTDLGGALSVASVAVMVTLMLMETYSFLTAPDELYVAVDTNAEQTLNINFDISVYELPCSMVDVEVWDSAQLSKLHVMNNKAGGSEIHRIVTFGDKYTVELGEATASGHVSAPISKESASKVFHDATRELTEHDFERVISQAKFAFVDFYAPWCIWCERLLPHWGALDAYLKASQLDVQLFKVDCDKSPRLCRDVAGYPTLRLYKSGIAEKPAYGDDRTMEAMAEWLKGKTESRSASMNVPAQMMKRMIENENLPEGCRIRGNLTVSRVPGNFHVVAYGAVFDLVPASVNLSHRINHFSFGDPLPQRVLRKIPKAHAERRHPFDSQQFITPNPHTSIDHYLKVVSAHYTAPHRKKSVGYLLTSSSRTSPSEPEIPEIRFSYDLAPTATVLTESSTRTWYDFLTNLCALVGGTYAVASIMDSSLHATFRQRAKDLRGKLG